MWRELVYDTWFWADQAWFLAAEAASLGYATELAEYALDHPRPTLKVTMLGLAGQNRNPDD